MGIEAHRPVRWADGDAEQVLADDDVRTLAVREHRACCSSARWGPAVTPRPSSDTAPVARRRRSSARAVSKSDAASGVTWASLASAAGSTVPSWTSSSLGVEPRELVGDGRAVEAAGDLEQLQVLRVGVEGREADVAVDGEECDAARDGGGVEQLGLHDHARAEHARHRALDEAPGNDLPHLVPDRDPLPGVEEFADVLRDRSDAARRTSAGGPRRRSRDRSVARRGSAPRSARPRRTSRRSRRGARARLRRGARP